MDKARDELDAPVAHHGAREQARFEQDLEAVADAEHRTAGICSERRNVVGMMPHPERACEPILGSGDGLVLFESVVRALSATGAVGTASR